MIMSTTPGLEVQARSRRAKRRTGSRAMDSATTTPALTPSSVIVRTSGVCSPTSDVARVHPGLALKGLFSDLAVRFIGLTLRRCAYSAFNVKPRHAAASHVEVAI